MAAWSAAVLLALVGVVHSWLGEAAVLRPLLADDRWRIPRVPRAAAEPLLRFAWHLTTIAWWALAAALVGLPVAYAFAATCLSAAAIILVMLPGHLAWPLFLTAGILALWSVDALPVWLLWLSAGIAIAAALVAAGFHIAWALGSPVGSANVLPQDPQSGEVVHRAGTLPTVAVAVLLTGFAGLIVAVVLDVATPWSRWLLVAVLAVLILRVIGDGRWMGITKRVRGTGFAAADDRWWTPAVALLALGAASALALN